MGPAAAFLRPRRHAALPHPPQLVLLAVHCRRHRHHLDGSVLSVLIADGRVSVVKERRGDGGDGGDGSYNRVMPLFM